jgi:hypothetical protein
MKQQQISGGKPLAIGPRRVIWFERVGLHAIGNIDRTIYHRAFPERTAIRFEEVEARGR